MVIKIRDACYKPYNKRTIQRCMNSGHDQKEKTTQPNMSQSM